MSRQSKKRPNLPSCQTIAEYWHSYWMENRNTPWGYIFDEFRLESPSCFACGFFKGEGGSNSWDSWNKAGQNGLERAHVIAHSLGGPSTSDNLVLLCKKCHEISPDCGNAEIMWAWMSECSQSLFNLHWSDLKGWMVETFAKQDEKFPGGLETLASCSSDEREEIFEQAGMNVGGVTTHRNAFSNATLAALYSEAIRLGWQARLIKANAARGGEQG